MYCLFALYNIAQVYIVMLTGTMLLASFAYTHLMAILECTGKLHKKDILRQIPRWNAYRKIISVIKLLDCIGSNHWGFFQHVCFLFLTLHAMSIRYSMVSELGMPICQHTYNILKKCCISIHNKLQIIIITANFYHSWVNVIVRACVCERVHLRANVAISCVFYFLNQMCVCVSEYVLPTMHVKKCL